MDKKINFSKYFKSILLKKLGALIILIGVVIYFFGYLHFSLASIIIGIVLMQFMRCPYCKSRVSGGLFRKPMYCNNCCRELPRKMSDIKNEEQV